MRKALYILGVLDDTDVDWIARHGQRWNLPRGSALIEKGKSTNSLFLLLDGQLAVHTGLDPATQVAQLGAGEIVGEISFVDRRPPTAYVTATLDCQVLALPRNLLSGKLIEDARFASRFYRAIAVFLADRLAVTTSRLGYGDVMPDETLAAPDELDETAMEEVSLANLRCAKLLRHLAGGAQEQLASFMNSAGT